MYITVWSITHGNVLLYWFVSKQEVICLTRLCFVSSFHNITNHFSMAITLGRAVTLHLCAIWRALYFDDLSGLTILTNAALGLSLDSERTSFRIIIWLFCENISGKLRIKSSIKKGEIRCWESVAM